MPRKFAPISKDDLLAKINKAFCNERGCIDPYHLKEVLGKDIKVEFDCENFEFCEDHYNENLAGLTGIVTLENGLTLVGFTAGGDWEYPVYFIVYWDGKKLRGYVPTEGNPWNTDTKQAFGNDEEADTKNAKKRRPDVYANVDFVDIDDFEFDGEAIKQDILNRIQKG